MEIAKTKMQYTTRSPRDIKIESGGAENKIENFQEIDSLCPGFARTENEYVAGKNNREYVPEEQKNGNCNDSNKFEFSKIIGKMFENTKDSSNVCSGLDRKVKIVEQIITVESQVIISEILEQVNDLSDIEKLLLYLKLPKGNETKDPLKQPINPLGNRLEICQTITWIKTHFEEDQDVSLPKQDVYGEYIAYCDTNGTKPLSTADFGKVMKQVFTHVRPRRLGTRGNSRYCYAGMCKKRSLKPPSLPDLGSSGDEAVVCEWASKILGERFNCLADLAHYLERRPATSENKEEDSFSERHRRSNKQGMPRKGENKRKLQVRLQASSEMKEQIKEQSLDGSKGKRVRTSCQRSSSRKEKHQEWTDPDQDVKKTVNNECKIERKPICDNSVLVEATQSHDLRPESSTKLKDSLLAISNEIDNESNPEQTRIFLETKLESTVNLKSKKLPETFSYLKDVSVKSQNEKLGSLPNSVVANKLSIPRLPKQTTRIKQVPANIIILPAVGSQSKRQYKPIRPRPGPGNAFRRPASVADDRERYPTEVNDKSKVKHANEVIVGCLEKNALDDYLHGDGNSQEQEEELIKYFKTEDSLEKDICSPKNKPDKCSSQLRLLLERNCNSDNNELGFCSKRNFPSLSANLNNPFISSTADNSVSTTVDDSSCSTFKSSGSSFSQANPTSVNSPLLSPSLLNCGLSTRRRVSFENIPHSVPQSPNTRRQIFSFTPISPRPYSSTKSKVKVVSSKCNSFLSPSNTPVPRIKPPTLQGVGSSPVSLNTNSTSGCQMTPHVVNQSSFIGSPSPTSYLRSRSLTNVKASDNIQDMATIHVNKIALEPSKLNINESGSSQGVFLPPGSPMSSCDSPVFNFHRKNSSPKLLDIEPTSLTQMPSLLETILLSGKQNDYIKTEEQIRLEVELQSPKSNSSSRVHSTDPLSQEVSRFFPEEETRLINLDFQRTFRSQSVPMVSSSALVSPLSSTQPFPVHLFRNTTNMSSSIPPTPVPSESADFGSTLNTESSSSNLLLIPATETDEMSAAFSEEQEAAANNILLDSDMNTENFKSILELIQDCESKPMMIGTESTRYLQQISRSYPNTPVPYSASYNRDDPIVSGVMPYPLGSSSQQTISRSYPCTPVISYPGLRNSEIIEDDIPSNSVARNNFYNSLLSEVDDEDLHNLDMDLPACEDTFNELERDVNTSVHIDGRLS